MSTKPGPRSVFYEADLTLIEGVQKLLWTYNQDRDIVGIILAIKDGELTIKLPSDFPDYKREGLEREVRRIKTILKSTTKWKCVYMPVVGSSLARGMRGLRTSDRPAPPPRMMSAAAAAAEEAAAAHQTVDFAGAASRTVVCDGSTNTDPIPGFFAPMQEESGRLRREQMVREARDRAEREVRRLEGELRRVERERERERELRRGLEEERRRERRQERRAGREDTRRRGD
ncbi:uncharacterized protein EV422DRAFT_572359 [Fimicolochytrium jonesii]|uniref:uncharacterized protein n=1 Tax=Fimicolochytrium jonesii TaxID=1396493 RepID=UPI0022FE1882|nr:uncharacterized protein EV422DRAFT_572359 [Fimicolochytrium jonesii]KAI8815883.1 hypothetical protein EV422DRAFT_572359 [Fimicolochytrium jonesii]